MTLAERWEAFSQRERYLVIAAGALGLMALLYNSPLARLGDLSSGGGEDERWVQLQKIENYQKLLARSDAANERTSALRVRYNQNQQKLIEGETPTQVGAELQGRMSTLASDAGLNVLSSQIVKEDEVEPFRRVGVRITLSGTLEGVTRLLSSIESGTTALSVTHLEINRKLGASRRPPTRSGAASSVAVSPLTATMEVKTLMRQAL